jgi:hypothetical protein
MHPNWIPQEIALTFIKMYSNLNITSSQVKRHLKYLKSKIKKIDPSKYLNNNINNSLNHTNDSNFIFLKTSSKFNLCDSKQ